MKEQPIFILFSKEKAAFSLLENNGRVCAVFLIGIVSRQAASPAQPSGQCGLTLSWVQHQEAGLASCSSRGVKCTATKARPVPAPAAPAQTPPAAGEAAPQGGAPGWRLDLGPLWGHPKLFPASPWPLPDGGRWQWDRSLKRCKTRQGVLPGRPLFSSGFVPEKLLHSSSYEDKVPLSFISKPCTLPKNYLDSSILYIELGHKRVQKTRFTIGIV